MDVVNGLIGWLTDPAQWGGPDGIPVRTLQHLWYSLWPRQSRPPSPCCVSVFIGHTQGGTLFAST